MKKTLSICCYGGSSEEIDEKYLDAGYALGREIARRGHGIVFGGGARGMMGAVARGTHSGGGKIIGVAPTFFDEPGVLFDKCDEFYPTVTMRERKQKMDDLADAFIVMPGGIGTLEEFFEMITLRGLGQTKKPVVMFSVGGFYRGIDRMMEFMRDEGFLHVPTEKLYVTFDGVEEMLDHIEKEVE